VSGNRLSRNRTLRASAKGSKGMVSVGAVRTGVAMRPGCPPVACAAPRTRVVRRPRRFSRLERRCQRPMACVMATQTVARGGSAGRASPSRTRCRAPTM
jgi:hypothetical protein